MTNDLFIFFFSTFDFFTVDGVSTERPTSSVSYFVHVNGATITCLTQHTMKNKTTLRPFL
jgi:hypothetical protein